MEGYGAAARYAMRRLGALVAVLFVASAAAFLLAHLSGSDAVLVRMERTGTVLTPEAIAAERSALGLDRPLLVQYGAWLAAALSGDLGRSYISGRDVASLFLAKLPATAALTAASAALALAVSVPLGVLAAVKKGSAADRLIRGASFLGNSVPGFLVGLLLLYVFAVRWAVVPVLPARGSVLGAVLPAATLALAMSAKYVRQVRAAVLEELSRPYVAGARARGVGMGRILSRSVLRSAAPALVSLFALSVGSLLGGAVVVESIFRWDGVGKLAADALFLRDYPVIQAYVLMMGVLFVVFNLMFDIIQCAVDPRLRKQETA